MATLLATITGALAGAPVDNIIGLHITSGVVSADCDAIAEQVLINWKNSMLSVLSQQLSVEQVDVVNVDDSSVGGRFVEHHIGSVSGATLPSFVVAKVNLTTALRGRAYRGRTGLSGLIEDWTDSTTPNVLKSTAQASLAEAFEEFRVALNLDLDAIAGGSAVAVVSQVLHGIPRVPAIATDVTDTNVALALGTRRGRM